MLEKIDLGKKMSKKEFDEVIAPIEIRIAELQRKCRELNIPIMIIFEGFGAAGKGTLINKLIRPLDPRGFKVFATDKASSEEKRFPPLWRFAINTPAKGRIHIFDRSWYQGIVRDDGTTYDEINHFERQLVDDGMLMIKFFLHISKKEQKKRFEQLESKKDTAWRVTKRDWKRNKEYDICLNVFDEMLIKTDKPYAPWTVVEASDLYYATCKIMTTTLERLEEAVTKASQGIKEVEMYPQTSTQFENGVLKGIDLSKTMTPEEYKKKRKDLQQRLSILHSRMYKEKVPVILAFEGWDAAGKGGAIKRITECMDPRGYEVVPTSSPNDTEKAHHYLWRFWKRIPKSGHMAIFDRTWYGRVIVERIEGFCSEEEWKRAYNEINCMEELWAKNGYIILKFWLHIDKDEQERRFKERQETPEKQWKITEEDWRNRSRWDEYEHAVDEMVVRTSTSYAPWTVVEADSKLYARIKVLETVVNALEKRLGVN